MMLRLDPVRWKQLSALLDELQPLPAPRREQRLAQLAQHDAPLVRDLRDLLAAADEASHASFLGGVADAQAGSVAMQVGDRLGPWELLGVVGEGGMGLVWKAQRADGRFAGHAAIKLLKHGHFDRGTQERFRREGVLLARLQHEGIARMLDAGVTPLGQPYLVLEWVDGQRIDHWCDVQSMTIAQRLALFRQVLAAVSAAHGQLAIHRDLKPGNILVDGQGQIKLLDFGIAKLLDEPDGDGLTREGVFPMTPSHAAPEQFTGGTLGITADVYALGVVLFELLTGRHPAGLEPPTTPMAYLRAASEGPMRRASDLARHPAAARQLAGDLDNILACATAAMPAQRYASVSAFDDDIAAYMQHRPVCARRAPWPERAAKFVRRNRLPVALSALAMVALLAGMAGTLGMAWRAQQSAQQAGVERERATAQALAAQQQRDLALGQANRAQRMSELTSYLAMARPAGQALTNRTLLLRAAEFVEAREGISPGHRAMLLAALGDQLMSANENIAAQQVLQRAKVHALASKDPSSVAAATCNLGWTLGVQGQFDAARREYQAGLAALPDEPRYLTSRISCLQVAESVERESGANVPAITAAELAVQLNERLPTPDPRGLNDSWAHLAMGYQMAGRVLDAEHAYRMQQRLTEQLHMRETQLGAVLYSNWSSLWGYAGRPLQALELSRESRRILNTGHPDAQDARVDVTFDELSWRNLGDLAQARRYSDRLLAKIVSGGHLGAVNIARINRVAILREQGRLDEATALIASSVQQFASLPPANYHFGLMRAEQGLIAARRGQHANAATLLDQAVQMLRDSSNATLFLPPTLLRRAEWLLTQSRWDEARRDALEARALLDTMLGTAVLSLHQGDAYQVLGRAARAQGQGAAARQHHADAARHYADSMGERHAKTLRAMKLAGN